jgi:hypothetical protein
LQLFLYHGGWNCQNHQKEFPEAYHADLNTISGDKEKLGTYSEANIIRDDCNFIILNAYTQFNWRGQGIKADYHAIRNVFKQIKQNFYSKNSLSNDWCWTCQR